MQTPEPEGNGERSLCAPYPWGTDTATARGAEGPRGHETLGRGTPPTADPGLRATRGRG